MARIAEVWSEWSDIEEGWKIGTMVLWSSASLQRRLQTLQEGFNSKREGSYGASLAHEGLTWRHLEREGRV
jgi:hypothetical protein